MTEADEQKLKELVAHLINGYQEMQQGVRLMTDVVVKLERRVADLEVEKAPKSKIILPHAARH